MANHVARLFRRGKIEADGFARSRRDCRRVFEKGTGFSTGLKEFFDRLTQRGVAGADLIEVSDALRGGQFQRCVENFNFAFGWLGHGFGF